MLSLRVGHSDRLSVGWNRIKDRLVPLRTAQIVSLEENGAHRHLNRAEIKVFPVSIPALYGKVWVEGSTRVPQTILRNELKLANTRSPEAEWVGHVEQVAEGLAGRSGPLAAEGLDNPSVSLSRPIERPDIVIVHELIQIVVSLELQRFTLEVVWG